MFTMMPAPEAALRGTESFAQESECARYTGHGRDQVLTELNPAVRHVGSRAPVRVDEFVGVGDREVLLTHAVIHVQRCPRRGLAEPVRLEGAAESGYVHHAGHGQVVAPV